MNIWSLTMCDTILASPASTAARIMLFGKNSDRQRNEAQAVEYLPGAEHSPGTHLACTYLTIPQVRRTHAVLLCRPFWTWGAEMGANEHGVVIGNEGLIARSPSPEEPALPGMDLVRLGLERAATAAEALEVITTLLELHGQGGNCGHLTPAYYNNGFMIADASEAFVLETVDREWVVERVRGTRAISNVYSVGRAAEGRSKGLLRLISQAGWSDEAEPDYAAIIQDTQSQHIGFARARLACSTALMNARDGRLELRDMMNVLRDHGFGDRHHLEWNSECTVKRTVCLHAGAEDRPAQTVGSMVSELRYGAAVHWVTGTAAPCMSIFKPVLMGVPLPSQGPRLTDAFDMNTLWWRHERSHRAALAGGVAVFLEDIREERDVLENRFRMRVDEVLGGGSIVDRAQMIDDCWREALEAEDRWYSQHVAEFSREIFASSGWRKLNQVAGMEWP